MERLYDIERLTRREIPEIETEWSVALERKKKAEPAAKPLRGRRNVSKKVSKVHGERPGSDRMAMPRGSKAEKPRFRHKKASLRQSVDGGKHFQSRASKPIQKSSQKKTA